MFQFMNSLENEAIIFVQNFLGFSVLKWFFPFYTDLHLYQWFIYLLILPALALWIYFLGRSRLSLFWIFIMNLIIIDALCGHVVKKTFQRHRPFLNSQLIAALAPASGFSFVSNHAANSFGLAYFFSYFYPGYKVLFWSFASLTAFSRIFNGVHYPSDVIVGGLFGVLISKLSIKLFERFNSNRRHL